MAATLRGRGAEATAAAVAAAAVTPGGGRLERFRARLRDRPDTEHEQAVTRLVVVPGMFAYMLWVPLPPAEADAARFVSFLIFAAGLAVAVSVILHIARHPGSNPVRRALSLLADVAGVAGGMLVGGTAASVFFPLLLWITLGYGFRYGRPYLIAAAVLSIVAFSLVLALGPDWRRMPFVGVAFLLALVILPPYFAVLLAKVTDAIRRAEEASRAKSHFLAAMSHEFRTPLNAVIGLGEVLATTRLDADQRDMVATVRAAAAGLLGLVDDVLDLARLEARRFTIDDAPFDLHELLATVRHLVLHAAAAKGLHLRLRLDAGTPYRLRGGPRALRQVLLNLVGNAVKFTEAGGVTIGVRPVAGRHDGDEAAAGAVPAPRLRFEVSDTGLGLSAEAQGRVFERFTQAEETRRKVVGGTGLGLSIARELVELMGGEIGVESASGGGSRFWFELPLAVADGDLTAEDAAAEAGRGEVVVLGGADETAAVLGRVARAGFRVRAVASAEAALEVVARHERPAMLLVTAKHQPVDLRALADGLAARGGPEPVDIVTWGAGAGELSGVTLADLPGYGSDGGTEDAATDDELRSCLRAALRRPARADGPAAAGGAGMSAAAFVPRRRLDILVAEDNRTNQKVVCRLLEHAGHTVRIVGDGQAAVDALDEAVFDAVLMDINMPEMDGIEAVKLLRFLHDPADLPPIVALSADATPDTEAACLDIGFSAFLTKPIDTVTLLATLDEFTASGRGGRRPRPNPAIAPPPASAGVATPAPPSTRGARPVAQHPTLDGEDGRPVLDQAKLASLALLDTGDGFLAQVIDEFLADAAGLVVRIEAAAASGDARAFRDEAHALRSSCAYLGAVAVFELCVGWRALDDDALMMRAHAETARLRREFARLHAALLVARPADRVAGAGRRTEARIGN